MNETTHLIVSNQPSNFSPATLCTLLLQNYFIKISSVARNLEKGEGINRKNDQKSGVFSLLVVPLGKAPSGIPLSWYGRQMAGDS